MIKTAWLAEKDLPGKTISTLEKFENEEITINHLCLKKTWAGKNHVVTVTSSISRSLVLKLYCVRPH